MWKKLREWKEVKDGNTEKLLEYWTEVGSDVTINFFLNRKYMFIPIKGYSHWYLFIVINADTILKGWCAENNVDVNGMDCDKGRWQKPNILILDSMGHKKTLSFYKEDREALMEWLNYIIARWFDEHNESIGPDVYILENHVKTGTMKPYMVPVPKQENDDVSCGLFLLKAVEKIGNIGGWDEDTSLGTLNLEDWFTEKDAWRYRSTIKTHMDKLIESEKTVFEEVREKAKERWKRERIAMQKSGVIVLDLD